ncbi:arsenate reductase ArsC [Aestuariibius sp. 2305UL40-4]|uniref:arsenate reductase ArsC n=1 Tax=Aestuariibius violaceus TaxID=3234132 RepID=UPI00345EDD1E
MDDLRTILILGTGNSARSLMAEAILNRDGAGRVRAFSAGSHPAGAPHPSAIRLLKRKRHDTSALWPKGGTAFAGAGAPPVDFVITVCDRMEGEVCPAWPGQPIRAHWGMPDPVTATGTLSERHLAFWNAYRTLELRVTAFLGLPLDRLDRHWLQAEVDRIGLLEVPGTLPAAPRQEEPVLPPPG